MYDSRTITGSILMILGIVMMAVGFIPLLRRNGPLPSEGGWRNYSIAVGLGCYIGGGLIAGQSTE